MGERRDLLLLIDGLINLVLGVLLLLYPLGLAQILGVPVANCSFYPTILGAVIFGIGMALVIERYGKIKGMTGLGLAGAIAINLCGGMMLLLWLLCGELDIPLLGRIILWAITIVVLLTGVVEITTGSWRESKNVV